MTIDFHTHTFRDSVAAKAMPSLAQSCGIVHPYTDGTLSSLKSMMQRSGVDLAVVLNIATKPTQHTVVNDYAAEINQDSAIEAFGSVYPTHPSALDELDRIAALGLKGIKFHPDYQEFFVDDDRVMPVYEKISQLGLITIFHAGYDLGLLTPCHCTPERLSRALSAFHSPVIAAHFGGFMLWDEVLTYLAGKDVYLDTSFSYGRLSPSLARKIVEQHGYDHVLFASDAPWSDMHNEMDYLKNLALPEAAYQAIFSDNAKHLLQI